MTVKTEKTGPVTTVIIDRPEVRNAVDPQTGVALLEAFEAFERDDDALVGVLTGVDGAFCAGADLKFVSETGFRPEWIEGDGWMGPSRRLLAKPVIGAIAGPAVAGGLELALWCDMRVAEEDAVLGVYCRRWGVPLVDGGTFRLPRIVGRGRALDYVLTGRRIDAAECHAVGLCEYLVPEGEARARAEALARDIARFPQTCLRADRASVFAGETLDEADALRAEWKRGRPALLDEGIAGAGRFAAGKGRGGDFEDI